jgi:hypothetical protein
MKQKWKKNQITAYFQCKNLITTQKMDFDMYSAAFVFHTSTFLNKGLTTCKGDISNVPFIHKSENGNTSKFEWTWNLILQNQQTSHQKIYINEICKPGKALQDW